MKHKKYEFIARAFSRIRRQATEATKSARGVEPYGEVPHPTHITHFVKEITNELEYVSTLLKEIEA